MQLGVRLVAMAVDADRSCEQRAARALRAWYLPVARCPFAQQATLLGGPIAFTSSPPTRAAAVGRHWADIGYPKSEVETRRAARARGRV